MSWVLYYSHFTKENQDLELVTCPLSCIEETSKNPGLKIRNFKNEIKNKFTEQKHQWPYTQPESEFTDLFQATY